MNSVQYNPGFRNSLDVSPHYLMEQGRELNALGWIGTTAEVAQSLKNLTDFLYHFIPSWYHQKDALSTMKALRTLSKDDKMELQKRLSAICDSEIEKDNVVFVEWYFLTFDTLDNTFDNYYRFVRKINEGHIKAITILQKYGNAFINSQRNCSSFLLIAVQENQITKVATAIIFDFNPNSINYDDTLLHKAASYGHLELIKLLVHFNARVNATNQSGDTPLHHAARAGNKETIDLLLSNGALVNIENRGGYLPLDHCVLWSENRIHKQLLEGSELKIRSYPLGSTLHLLLANSRKINGKYTVEDFNADLKSLIERIPNPNLRNSQGQTPLHVIGEPICEHVITLIDAVGDLNLPDDHGSTPCHTAIACGRVNTLRILLERGADLNAVNRAGFSVRQFAKYINDPKINGVITEYETRRKIA